jgi:hypothetical protein
VKVSYVEGVANHNGLESCGVARKGDVEALTEERAGWVLSRENMTLLRKQQALQGADALEISGKATLDAPLSQGAPGPARSETPCMYGTILCGNREIPCQSAAERASDRIGKPKGVRQ